MEKKMYYGSNLLVITLNEILTDDSGNRGLRRGLDIAIRSIEKNHNIKIDKEIEIDLFSHDFNIDDELCILSYKTNREEETKYIDLKTGEFRELTDMELIICDFKCCIL